MSVDEIVVAIATATAGPTMKDSSVPIESSANAGRRWSSGTIAITDWRTRPKMGIAKRPANTATISRPK